MTKKDVSLLKNDLQTSAQESFRTLELLKLEQKVIKDFLQEECEKNMDYVSAKEAAKEHAKAAKEIEKRIKNTWNTKMKRLDEIKLELKDEKDVFDLLAEESVKKGVQLSLFNELGQEFYVVVNGKVVAK